MSDPLFIHRRLETRWACAENPKGAKGGACRPDVRLDERHAHLTHDRKVSPCLSPLRAGQSFTMAESSGAPGTIRRIWSTFGDRSTKMLRAMRLEIFWDGATKPAVSVPFGDFFCQTLGRMSTFENALFSSPEGRSFNSILPMPFRDGFRMVVTNESNVTIDAFFYEVDWTVGDEHGADALWLHAHWHRENPTTLHRDYEFLPHLPGKGRLLGVNFGVISNLVDYHRSWWGEGEVKIFLDGDDAHPTLCGTGTEDYIGTGWGQERYAHLYQGSPLADSARMQYGFYRLHVPDPIFFQQEIRATIQQIGCAGPDTRGEIRRRGLPVFHGDQLVDLDKFGVFERQDDWSSCVWFYLDRTTNELPPLPSVEQRTAGLMTEV
jgi:hypothetical protein